VLHIHRADRADGLVDALSALLLEPTGDPFAVEVVAVPTRGMERWLTQRISARVGATPGRQDGVCANIDFPFPSRLVAGAVAAGAGVDPDGDPWLAERLVWPLLRVVDRCLGEPWLACLTSHLGGAGADPDPARRSRRFSSVRHIADLFGRYGVRRPEMLRAWAGGEDRDATGARLPGDAAWQAELWRRLRAEIALPSPAERLEDACLRLREDPALVELPARISLFGLTRLPASYLQVLSALALGRAVHLFLLHPSPQLWDRVAGLTEARPPIVRRSEDVTATLPAHPLLASWGHDARELQLVVSAGGEHVSVHHPVTHAADTLLTRVQADVRADRAPPGPPLPGLDDIRPVLDPGDRSVQVHACHGRARQVEVVRDAILHLLEDDPTLEPRDVIVMCPDIDAFAPLIQATFGAGEVREDDEPGAPTADIRPRDLRVRLADRSLRQTNPMLGFLTQLIDLAEQRATASELLDLADREPVRRRFRFDDDDLARMREWVAASGIRWGLDAAHRSAFQLETLPAGTWRAGLDRVLLGVTMTEDGERLFEKVLPLDDVDSGAISLAGRLAEFVDRVEVSVDALSTPKTMDAWAAVLAAAADALTATSERDSWQRSELGRLLAEVTDEATVAGAVNTTKITLPELRSLLAGRLQGRPTRANFRTGHLTICTLVPMRSVPHRVVCLLGLDDGAFPRKAPRDGDDLMLADPHVGDRDPRTEDRQLLLDALLAASERLIVTYTGNDERTNAPRPSAVPVGELLDVVDATVRTGEGRAWSRVLVRHPLQPFDPRNFEPGALVPGRSWSFEQVMLEGAQALSGPRAPRGPFLAEPLPAVEARAVEAEDLVSFVQHPVKAFLRQRLGISVGDHSDEVEDALSVELDGLGKWGVGHRLLDARLAGVDGRDAILAEIARGTLPPGVLGQPVIRDLFPIVEDIVAATERLVPGSATPGSVDIRVVLPDGRPLTGTVPGVTGDVLLTVTFSRVAAKHRLAAWTRLLVPTAAFPERPSTPATIGRGRGSARVSIARIPLLAPDATGRRRAALGHLARIVDLHDRGMREPLPLFCQTSGAYAEAAAAGRDPVAAGRDAWTSGYMFDREDKDPEHRFVFGDVLTFEELLAVPPHSGEAGDGWEMTETTRLGRCARRMWDGLLACEELAER
jgi:exodeoxyribonuclease V gamma subunit